MHRQLLLGFMNQYADENYNPGYDGEILDPQPNDAYFALGNINLIIQGVGYFNTANSYPLTVVSNQSGLIKFMIDDLENFDSNQPIYIHDNLTDTYHDISNSMFEIIVPAGIISSRFSLRFYNPTLSSDSNSIENTIIAYFDSQNQEIKINNPVTNLLIEEVTLYSILGQKLEIWDVLNQDQKNISLKVKNLSKGVYILLFKTNDSKSISKKIIYK